jgi:hypothetical protein
MGEGTGCEGRQMCASGEPRLASPSKRAHTRTCRGGDNGTERQPTLLFGWGVVFDLRFVPFQRARRPMRRLLLPLPLVLPLAIPLHVFTGMLLGQWGRGWEQEEQE